jgi:hypothetical protein
MSAWGTEELLDKVPEFLITLIAHRSSLIASELLIARD